jgi:AraC-like DNA-binding protein
MSASAPHHHSRIFASPWPGVYSTLMDSGRHYGRHWHATYGFGVLESGAQRSTSGRGMVDAHAGDILTHNPGEVHDGWPLGGESRRWRMVYLEPEALASIAGFPDDAGAIAIVQPVIDDARLRRALQRLLLQLEAWHNGPRATGDDTLACEEALAHACDPLLARHATAAAPAGADDSGDMARVRERLADGSLQAPSLAELAACAGAGSRFQLLRRFRQAYGVTPHAWLLQLRAERARGLIRQGIPLADAAAQAGFADQSHMTRIFGRQFGFTPGAWQQAARLQ